MAREHPGVGAVHPDLEKFPDGGPEALQIRYGPLPEPLVGVKAEASALLEPAHVPGDVGGGHEPLRGLPEEGPFGHSASWLLTGHRVARTPPAQPQVGYGRPGQRRTGGLSVLAGDGLDQPPGPVPQVGLQVGATMGAVVVAKPYGGPAAPAAADIVEAVENKLNLLRRRHRSHPGGRTALVFSPGGQARGGPRRPAESHIVGVQQKHTQVSLLTRSAGLPRGRSPTGPV